MREMNTESTATSRSARYRELKHMLEGRRRELHAEVQGKMRDVRASGEVTASCLMMWVSISHPQGHAPRNLGRRKLILCKISHKSNRPGCRRPP